MNKILTDEEIKEVMKRMAEYSCYWSEDEDGIIEYSRMLEESILKKLENGR